METSIHSRSFYNAKMQDAYNQLLSERDDDRSVQFSVAGSEEDEDEFSDDISEDFSNDIMELSDRSSHGRSEVNDDYEQFKTSLMRDEWLELGEEEDDEDKDYTEEADRSFIMENDEPEVDVWMEDNTRSWQTAVPKARNIWALIAFVVLFLSFIWRPGFSSGGSMHSSLDTPVASSNAQLRAQLNSLYRELQDDRKTAKKELDNAIRLVILQVEKNLKKLLPRDLGSVQSQLQRLDTQVQDLSRTFSLNNVTEWQDSLVFELEHLLPEQIPVVLNNSTQALMVVPELHRYLAQIIPQVVNKTVSIESTKPFQYDTGQYVREILRDEYQYVDKSFFLKELDLALKSSKEDILREMESRISTLENVPQQYSNVLQRKLIHKIYNANQHQWQDDVDFATVAQGTRLLNHLCSTTFQGLQGIPPNGVTPLDLLADAQPAPSTYWLCSDKNSKQCAWAVRFAQPLYLTRIAYVHGRFTNNLHLMNSAPSTISVYVKLQSSSDSEFRRTAARNGHGATWAQDRSFIEIGSWNYDNSDPRIRQNFPLPPWFIQCKPQVRSLALVVRSNNGNAHYTALRKFVVNAVTAQDLQLSSTYVQSRQFEIPEYSSPLEDTERVRASQVAAWQQRNNPAHPGTNADVPSFGQDEFDEN
ncbi:LANO_0E15412g1_1 [Lachancea nothofagi CBS 11611]|uniref:LANO_0E15412g1_1 n=1 Tax=Lachancea nothofagi CBS 11611 TaxID=1266666 RepID=A0A1G4K0Z0_9SACH|nr:LANO_0E15412g1_1 [Lachancea nothofagi CBS 11611]